MNLSKDQLRALRAVLVAELSAIQAAQALGEDGRKTVELDQQSVGRLSRMDALQQQAMANANHARRGTNQFRLTAAIERMNSGEYGDCLECGEPIVFRRLQIDPAVLTCVRCASGG